MEELLRPLNNTMIFDLLLILMFLRKEISKQPCHREHNMLIKNS